MTNTSNISAEYIANTYRLTAALHTHTNHSKTGPILHARGSVMENVAAAHAKGLREIAITDHGPGHYLYGVGGRHIAELRSEIAAAQAAFPDIKIYLGVEANFKDTPNGLDVTPEEFELYDLVNAGYHFGVTRSYMLENKLARRGLLSAKAVERLRAKNTELALRAIYNNPIKVLTHPGDKGPFDMEALYKACEETGTLLEINSRHSHLTVSEIAAASRYDVSFILGSDAHRPRHVGSYERGIIRAIEAGLDLRRIVNLEER